MGKMHVDPLSWAAIEKKVTSFLMQYCPFHLDSPRMLDLERILDIILPLHLGFNVEIGSTESSCEAETDMFRRKVLFSTRRWEMLCNGDLRTRFTAAHELGHVLLHASQFEQAIQTNIFRFARESDPPPYKDSECQANCAAGALLIPHVTLKVLLASFSLKTATGVAEVVREMEHVYGVSSEAAKVRLMTLGYILKERKGAPVSADAPSRPHG